MAPVGDPTAPPAVPVDAEIGAEPTRFAEFFLGAVALFAVSVPGAPGGFLVGQVALLALIGLSVFRTPTRSMDALRWLPYAAAAMLGYLVLVSVAGPDVSLFGWQKRALRLALVFTALLVMVSGRVHFPSLVRGMAAGLVGNAVLFFAGVAPAPYGRFLSGYLLDKNQAGLAYTVVGILLVAVTTDRRRQVAVVIATSGLVWTTGSRTSLAALACALVWFVLRPYLNVPGACSSPPCSLSSCRSWRSGTPRSASSPTGWAPTSSGPASTPRRRRSSTTPRGTARASGRPGPCCPTARPTSSTTPTGRCSSRGAGSTCWGCSSLTVWFGIRPLRPGPPPSLFAPG